MNRKNKELTVTGGRPGSILLPVIIALSVFSCGKSYAPKPHTYFRIDFPEKNYRMYDSSCPFTFEYPVYGTVAPASEPCKLDIRFPEYKSTIYLTYLEIDRNFDVLMEDNWTFIYKKIAQRADAVEPREYADPEHRVYGEIYDIRGNAASSVQFFVTDSVKNYLRGSLYFAARPNQDSLAPAISFFREDIVHLMNSIRWKDGNMKTKE